MNAPEPRFHVHTRYSQNGAIAEVRDRKKPNDCRGYYSTIRDGAGWLECATIQCAALNKSAARNNAAPPVRANQKRKTP